MKSLIKNCLLSFLNAFEPQHEKPDIVVSDQVQHKPGCPANENGWRLETSDLGRRGVVLCTEKKALISYG